jgi:hypothetical protein
MQRGTFDLAVHALKNTTSVELLVMVMAYCSDFDAEKMLHLALSINLNALFSKIDRNDGNEVNSFNNFSISKVLLLRGASMLRSLPDLRFDDMNRIAWSCPPRLFDTKFKIYIPFAKIEPELYDPHHSTLNLVQMMLNKHFKLTFFETRFMEELDEAFEWKEAIGFANFMLEKYLPYDRFRFHDPIHQSLMSRPIYQFTYKTLYYQKVKEIEYANRPKLIK